MPFGRPPGLTCNRDHQDDTWSAWTTSYETSLTIYGDALKQRRRFAGLRCANFCFPASAKSPSQTRSQRTHGPPDRRRLSLVDNQDNLDYTNSVGTPCDEPERVEPRTPRRGARIAHFNGLESLHQCLDRYVRSNSSRFRAREEWVHTKRILTIILCEEAVHKPGLDT